MNFQGRTSFHALKSICLWTRNQNKKAIFERPIVFPKDFHFKIIFSFDRKWKQFSFVFDNFLSTRPNKSFKSTDRRSQTNLRLLNPSISDRQHRLAAFVSAFTNEINRRANRDLLQFLIERMKPRVTVELTKWTSIFHLFIHQLARKQNFLISPLI